MNPQVRLSLGEEAALWGAEAPFGPSRASPAFPLSQGHLGLPASPPGPPAPQIGQGHHAPLTCVTAGAPPVLPCPGCALLFRLIHCGSLRGAEPAASSPRSSPGLILLRPRGSQQKDPERWSDSSRVFVMGLEQVTHFPTPLHKRTRRAQRHRTRVPHLPL